MGFEPVAVSRALRAAGNDPGRAVKWLLENPDSSAAGDADGGGEGDTAPPQERARREAEPKRVAEAKGEAAKRVKATRPRAEEKCIAKEAEAKEQAARLRTEAEAAKCVAEAKRVAESKRVAEEEAAKRVEATRLRAEAADVDERARHALLERSRREAAEERLRREAEVEGADQAMTEQLRLEGGAANSRAVKVVRAKAIKKAGMAELAEQFAVLELERDAREDDQQQWRVQDEAAASRPVMTMKERRVLAHRNKLRPGYHRPSDTTQFQQPDTPPMASLSAVAGAGFGGLASISSESTETGSGSTRCRPRRKSAVEYSEDDRDWLAKIGRDDLYADLCAARPGGRR
jgi:hypothetical protein